MRNLKRVLSLALASVMLIGMMVVGASAVNYDDFSDKDKIVNKEAVSTLVELGVIAGKDDGTYDPTGIVTRGEMAKMICVVLNGGKDPSLGNVTKYSYTDTVGHWAAPYIEYCAIRGIVAGKGDGTFGPNETVTGSQAAKMLLVAAGYQSAIEGFTGANWEVNTNVRANAVGLYDGLDINPSQGLTRDSAAQMVYNILDVEQVTYKYTMVANGDGTFTSVTEIDKTADNKTVLEDKFGAVKVEGVVVANEVADLNSSKKNDNKVLVGSALDAGKTKIVITNGGKDEDQNEYTGTQTFKVSTGLDQLGRTVRLYVKTGSSAANAKVFGSVIVTDDNKVVTDASDDSINSVADDNSLDIVSGTKVATNYADLTDLSSDAAKADGTHGVQKILIDNNDDGDVDYVLLTTYVFGKVTGKSTSSDGSLTVNYSGAATLSVDDKDDVVGFDDVAKNDYVLAAFIGGKLHVQKAESVTGTLDAYTSTSLTVDGTKYTVSAVGCYKSTSDDITPAKGYASKSELDKDATFYLDVNGYIVAVGAPEASAYDYAYVWGSEAGSSIGTDRVKVTLSDGTKATYDLDDDSDIDIEDDGDFEGQIFAYKVSGNEIKLTKPAGKTAEGEKVVFEKGKTTVDGLTTADGQTKFANKNTVFFYVTTKTTGNVTKIDSVDVYTGYSAAPDVDKEDNASAFAAYNKGGKMVAVAITSSAFNSTDLSDHVFIYKKDRTFTDYTEVRGFLAGMDQANTELKVSDNSNVDAADAVDGQIYLYTKDSDGYLKLKEAGDNLITVNGKPTNVSSSSVVVKGKEYAVTSKTVLIDNTDNPGTPSATLGAAPEDDDVITYMLVDDDEILMMVIDNTAEETPETPDNVTVTVKDDKITLTYTKEEPGVTDQANAVVAKLTALGYTDIDVTVAGGKVTGVSAKMGVVSYTFTYEMGKAAE
ncbi:S-layer homology domain-containing protein [Intestinimonas massiliensis]|uniref:S-layer homology domain-containing protein n=1 Tax=Intestinimonas massiliensis (ex Afouda et al. 2020) TaxID=1673721 RepID=UPI002109EF03|nr:S-layer homology domain-containing protein [Intestinimonas massiliensis (ex Afouda et al. 2020)]MCQ4807809.1 S-layer homology domain-containing protein [Intestinimonas massiliensis (ex Afouda et al. 2020)]